MGRQLEPKSSGQFLQPPTPAPNSEGPVTVRLVTQCFSRQMKLAARITLLQICLLNRCRRLQKPFNSKSPTACRAMPTTHHDICRPESPCVPCCDTGGVVHSRPIAPHPTGKMLFLKTSSPAEQNAQPVEVIASQLWCTPRAYSHLWQAEPPNHQRASQAPRSGRPLLSHPTTPTRKNSIRQKQKRYAGGQASYRLGDVPAADYKPA